MGSSRGMPTQFCTLKHQMAIACCIYATHGVDSQQSLDQELTLDNNYSATSAASKNTNEAR
eukprot:1428764-Amphidinium_carterae.1